MSNSYYMFCTSSSHVNLHLCKVSWKYLRHRADGKCRLWCIVDNYSSPSTHLSYNMSVNSQTWHFKVKGSFNGTILSTRTFNYWNKNQFAAHDKCISYTVQAINIEREFPFSLMKSLKGEKLTHWNFSQDNLGALDLFSRKFRYNV